jgi:hypothetical protein
MSKEETLFQEIGTSLKGVTISQMFGMPTLKVNGKALAGLHGKDMVFKLAGDAHAAALMLKGAHLFEPMKGRPMREWVQVPPAHKTKWEALSKEALKYVKKKK